MIPFVFVRLSVFKDEASTQGFLASPLGQGERTKVRGPEFLKRHHSAGSINPHPPPLPCKGRGDLSAHASETPIDI